MQSKKTYLKTLVLALRLLFVFALLCPSKFVFSEEDVVVGLLVGRDIDRDVYMDFILNFSEQNPRVAFDHIAANDEVYKAEVDNWLAQGKVDVSYGQVGNRLCQHAAENKIASLDKIWHNNSWEKVFSDNFRRSVSCNGKVYGVPIAYYYWGFFYKKSLFQRLGLIPPETWEQFLDVNQHLKLNGIVPIAIGTKNKWPAAAWFDYINLRINGLEFHQQLLSGNLSFLSPEVQQVFTHWKILVENGYFIEDQQQMDWQQALPFLYRDMAGMMLTGGFLAGILPPHLREDIGFFRFPTMKDSMPQYEEVPIDVYMLNSLSAENESAKALLNFVAKSDNQQWLSGRLGYLLQISTRKFPMISFQKWALNTWQMQRDTRNILTETRT